MSDASNEPVYSPETDPEGTTRTLKRVGIGAAVVAIVVVAAAIIVRTSETHNLTEIAADASVPSVTFVHPSKLAASNSLVLPGNIQAYNSAAIYARTNGYVRRWLADIGDHVRAGQPLAILDAPDVDQQLAQARADYQTALANQKLAETTAKRWTALSKQDAVSQQESDEKQGDMAAKTAVANAAMANVNRLRALQGFAQLSAPFAGIVTSRSAQIGALVVSGTAASQPLFTVSDVHRVRIYVRVPQLYVAAIKPGLSVDLSLPEYPGRTFKTVLTRSANAVDPQSGTVLVELQADNPEGVLKPGAYAQLSFPIANMQGSVHLPVSAVVYGEDGPTVVTIDASNHALIKKVKIGRDEGAQVEIIAGLTGAERVIDTPPDAIQNGDPVKPQAAPAKAEKHESK